jgi:hypothetical protein
VNNHTTTIPSPATAVAEVVARALDRGRSSASKAEQIEEELRRRASKGGDR